MHKGESEAREGHSWAKWPASQGRGRLPAFAPAGAPAGIFFLCRSLGWLAAQAPLPQGPFRAGRARSGPDTPAQRPAVSSSITSSLPAPTALPALPGAEDLCHVCVNQPLQGPRVRETHPPPHCRCTRLGTSPPSSTAALLHFVGGMTALLTSIVFSRT